MTTIPKNWIWTSLPYDDTKPNLCYFRRTFFLSQNPQQALCRLTADSRYCFFVNGKLICRGPRKGDEKIWFYDEIDLAPWLQKGENVFAAIVLRYPCEISKGNRSVFRMKVPAFAACGILENKTDRTEWQTDSNWKTRLFDSVQIHASYPDTNRLYIQENAHGIAEMQNWQLPGYDEKDWVPAIVYPKTLFPPAVSPAFLRPRPIPFLYETPRRFVTVFRIVQSKKSQTDWEAFLQKDTPLTIEAHSTEIVELIADRLTTGYLKLAVFGGLKSQIEILEAESYAKPSSNPHGPFKKDRLDWKTGELTGPVDNYEVGGYGTPSCPETYEPFWFRTFRFIRLKLTTFDTPLTICRFFYRETGYPLEIQTQVHTSDPTLADIWTISENSLRACMQETYVDCPFYEQLQYAMDSRVEILFTYTTSADDRLARQTIDDFARSQRADGLLNACYPTCKPNVIPQFSIYYILMLYDHMMYFGDASLIRTYLPTVERILNFFLDRIDSQGLVGKISDDCYWKFVDWADGWPVGVPPAAKLGALTMDSLMLCLGLLKAADLAQFLGRMNQATEYLSIAFRLQQSIRKYCTGRNGLLQDGPNVDQYSQHVQVFSVLTDTLTKEEASAAIRYTLKDPQITSCSVAMGYYLFRALEKTGLYDYTDTLWEKWRIMLANHLTTCQENDGDYVRSDCHAWGALALYELPSVSLGIRPAKPGFAAVRFSPVPGKLTYASGQMITPKGLIQASWKLEHGKIQKKIVLPEGLTVIE